MDIAALISRIKKMNIAEDEKKLMVDALEKDGEAALAEIATYLEISAQNDELSGRILEEEADTLTRDTADAIAKLRPAA